MPITNTITYKSKYGEKRKVKVTKFRMTPTKAKKNAKRKNY